MPTWGRASSRIMEYLEGAAVLCLHTWLSLPGALHLMLCTAVGVSSNLFLCAQFVSVAAIGPVSNRS